MISNTNKAAAETKTIGYTENSIVLQETQEDVPGDPDTRNPYTTGEGKEYINGNRAVTIVTDHNKDNGVVHVELKDGDTVVKKFDRKIDTDKKGEKYEMTPEDLDFLSALDVDRANAATKQNETNTQKETAKTVTPAKADGFNLGETIKGFFSMIGL
jgi:hypothetical protein